MTHSRKRASSQANGRPLLSHTSILIISIFILGMATGNVSSVPANSAFLMMGVFGVISYFGLGALADSRERKRRQQILEQKEEALEGRLERHLTTNPQCPPPQRVTSAGSLHNADRQAEMPQLTAFQNR